MTSIHAVFPLLAQQQEKRAPIESRAVHSVPQTITPSHLILQSMSPELKAYMLQVLLVAIVTHIVNDIVTMLIE
jgi:hypothetical protein